MSRSVLAAMTLTLGSMQVSSLSEHPLSIWLYNTGEVASSQIHTKDRTREHGQRHKLSHYAFVNAFQRNPLKLRNQEAREHRNVLHCALSMRPFGTTSTITDRQCNGNINDLLLKRIEVRAKGSSCTIRSALRGTKRATTTSISTTSGTGTSTKRPQYIPQALQRNHVDHVENLIHHLRHEHEAFDLGGTKEGARACQASGPETVLPSTSLLQLHQAHMRFGLLGDGWRRA